LVTILTPNRRAIRPAPDTRAAPEMLRPARRKKNGVRSANAMLRMRSMSTRSERKTPATTSPAR